MNKKTIGCIDGNCNDGSGTYIEDCVDGLGDKYQRTYVGEFKSSKRHGLGVFTDAAGIKWQGRFEKDKGKGQGTFIYPDGSTLVSPFGYFL